MKRKLSLLLLFFLMIGTPQAFAYNINVKPFYDLKETDWSAEYVYFLSALDILAGYPDKSFRPEEPVTREAFVKMLVTTAKINPVTSEYTLPLSMSVDDVVTARWSYSYIDAAYQNHLIDFLIEERSFFPAQAITREEVATLVGNYLLSLQTEEIKSQWLGTGWQYKLSERPFVDLHQFRQELLPNIYFTVDQKIMEGDHLGSFRPSDSLSRKEAAAIIYRLIENRIKDQSIDLLGYYAFSSYVYLNKVPLLSNLTLGWSEMEYPQPGKAFLKTTGEWKIPQGYEEVIQMAEQANVKRDLMIFYNKPNLVEFLRDEEAQETFITSLLGVLNDPQFGFTGVNIDFEGLKGIESQQDFIQFLNRLKLALEDKTITVAVPPTYFFKGYDLQRIGEVADYVLLMAYDFTHKESRLPSAPLELVNDSLVDLLQVVPKEKVILGVSKQANQWITTSSGIEYYQPRPYLVEERLQQSEVVHRLGYPYLMNRITFKDERGSHEIWYEGSESIKQKMMLAKYYGVHGLSLWYMGNYTEADWRVIEEVR